jgi:regulator of protease activity HflC (stomatin/prohibitin superfamily)
MQHMRVTIKKNERGLLLRNGDFDRILAPGNYNLFAFLDKLKLETFSIEQAAFIHPLASYLFAKEPAVVSNDFIKVDLSETQAGLRLEDGVLVEILPPTTRRLYWRGLREINIKVIDISAQAELSAELTQRLTQTQLRTRSIEGLAGVLQIQVADYQTGVLWIDGKLVRLLPPGNYGFWKFGRTISVELIDLRLQQLEVTGQEILTKDKVALRLNLSATWRYSDVIVALTQLQKPVDHLYRELQFGLRSAVGTRTLDELLENKHIIDDVVTTHVRQRLANSGLLLDSVGIKDIVLPGEMKTLLAKVVEAEKAAQANVIRRREETAATRSLLNTAKVMEGNAVALRMKELETLERVAERIDKISVVGGLDSVLNGLIKIQ